MGNFFTKQKIPYESINTELQSYDILYGTSLHDEGHIVAKIHRRYFSALDIEYE